MRFKIAWLLMRRTPTWVWQNAYPKFLKGWAVDRYVKHITAQAVHGDPW